MESASINEAAKDILHCKLSFMIDRYNPIQIILWEEWLINSNFVVRILLVVVFNA